MCTTYMYTLLSEIHVHVHVFTLYMFFRRLENLKARIRKSGLEVFDNYPCRWGGVADGKPMVAGLEAFGQRALRNLWNAVEKQINSEVWIVHVHVQYM